ncbi:hypothetical protein ACE6H2_008522 [Prunus campanulata]
MGGGIRSNVKRFTVKRGNLGAGDSNLSAPQDAHSAEKKPFLLPETNTPSPYGPSQSVTDGTPLSSPHYDKFQAPSLGAKDFMEMMAINDKETSEGLLKKRKSETSELEELSEKIEYVNGFAPAYRYQTPTDILLLAGDHGPSVPAHKLLLANRSKILNHIPNSYGSKAPSNQVNTITLHELNHEELESLLDFLYNADCLKKK